MPKIGILGCHATTREMDCVMIGCCGNLRSRQGEFARYAADDPPELVGIINCGGCPTAVGGGKVWQKARALIEYGVKSLHLTSCLIQICPFKDEFVEAIRREYPNLEVIEGTHAFHNAEAFKKGIRPMSVSVGPSGRVPLTILMNAKDDMEFRAFQPPKEWTTAIAGTVRDADGNPVPGVQVSFQVTAGGGSVSGSPEWNAGGGPGGRKRRGPWPPHRPWAQRARGRGEGVPTKSTVSYRAFTNASRTATTSPWGTRAP